MEFFTSDLHFFHRKLVGVTNRWRDTDEDAHNEWLINLWNSTVGPSDTVYHLGDFSILKTPQRVGELLEKLNGRKYFITGNHDEDSKGRIALFNYRGEHGVEWVGAYKRINIGEADVMLFHYPISTWHKQHYGSWHLHGHSHGNHICGRGKILDVGLDASYLHRGEHKFYSAKEIAEYMESRPVEINDSHRVHNQTLI